MLAARYPQPSIWKLRVRIETSLLALAPHFVGRGEQPAIHTLVLLALYATNSDNIEPLTQGHSKAPLRRQAVTWTAGLL